MVSSASRKIKLSVNLKPFVSRVVRNGRVQRAFAEQIGKPVGACVRSGVRTGMSGAEIHEVARGCAKAKAGTRLSLGAVRARVAPRATGEYFEIA